MIALLRAVIGCAVRILGALRGRAPRPRGMREAAAEAPPPGRRRSAAGAFGRSLAPPGGRRPAVAAQAPVALDPALAARLLGREPVAPQGGGDDYAGRSVMVTGAGGTIGAELCRQLLPGRPRELILLDLSEAALYTADKDLRRSHPGAAIRPVLGSAGDAGLLRGLFARHRVDVLFHAAAYKHVPLIEANPLAGIENNVLATRTLAEAAGEARVPRFLLVSTDKAVRPASVMGATKRLAELVLCDLAERHGTTRFSIVRFGNVLGSSGSVVPLFAEQIARGGPVTLTHPDATRYFMTIAEAARLVLAVGAFPAAEAEGPETFVLDMGRPRRIRDLAEAMIAAAGRRPQDASRRPENIEIRLIGLRPGEKLHEDPAVAGGLRATPHPRILRAAGTGCLSVFEIARMLAGLRAALDTRDIEAARHLLFRWAEPQPPAARQPASAAGTSATTVHIRAPARAEH